MSHHYSASQFTEPFKPIRLNNYSPFTNTPAPYGVHAVCLPDRCCPTEIIADDNGHLFPCIPRGPSSPWGDYSTSVLEMTATCLCIDKLRNPHKYQYPPRHIFIAREDPCHEKTAQEVGKEMTCPGVFQNMIDRNALGYGGGDASCCPKSCCSGFPMKVVLCSGEADKKRVISEMKRQQREWRRQVAGVRGRGKGRMPFSPGCLFLRGWDDCKGKRGVGGLGRVFGCSSC